MEKPRSVIVVGMRPYITGTLQDTDNGKVRELVALQLLLASRRPAFESQWSRRTIIPVDDAV